MKFNIKKFLRQLFCRHKHGDIICWHWTHGINDNEIAFIEIQLKCKDCGKYYYAEIRDRNQCNQFVEKQKDKEWSDVCCPVLL